MAVSIDAVRAAAAAAATPAAAVARPRSDAFSTVLGRHLDEPRAAIDEVRAEVAALRGGGALALALSQGASGGLDAAGFTGMPAWLNDALAQQSTGDEGDPYGWRALSRTTGEQVIGPGYGALFERQIQQESGFLPDVVYGVRVSSAGAEGIAQLMPQYYQHVDRRDPAASLLAGAQTMRDHLSRWDGDVRRALASYNAGAGRVAEVVAAHGEAWESALPQETRDYLAAIVGDARPRYTVGGALVLDPGRVALGAFAP